MPYTDAQFADIGRVFTRWATTEDIVASYTCHLFGETNDTPLRRRMRSAPLSQNLPRLQAAIPIENERARYAADEIAYAVEIRGDWRNALAHGFHAISIDGPLARHERTGIDLWADVLPNLVEWASYAKFMAIALHHALAGIDRVDDPRLTPRPNLVELSPPMI